MTTMKRFARARRWAVAATVCLLALTAAGAGSATHVKAERSQISHVLLISVDGLHQFDLTQCAATNLCPNLALLANFGTTYANASTSEPSDSSPGLVALTTGATPKLSGVYYDDSYDRTMFTPAAQTSTGTQDCSGAPGAETMYAENIDTNAPSTANGQVGTRTILNEAIDQKQLPYVLDNGSCVPVMPNDFLRNNSIFSVAHAAGMRTAWADKHPAADQTVSGHGTPNSVDDPLMTEINADCIPSTLVDTRGTTVTFPLPNPTCDPNGYFITDYVQNTEAYDQIKVDAILNHIDGKTSSGVPGAGVPAIFGMNFQTVSVGQKLVDPVLSCARSHNARTCDPNYFPGGYEPGTLAFTPQLSGAIASVDTQLGSMVSELRAKGMLDSTEIVISAKHGQSPIDPSKLAKIGHTESAVVSNAGVSIAQTTDDDIALLWLQDQSQTSQAVAALEADKAGADTARVDYVLSGDPLADRFNSPLVDPRTPDLIVQPIPGTIYSTSKSKVAEHGGFAADDTHVAMILTNGAALNGAAGAHGRVIGAAVTTNQVAPSVLKLLGLDPRQLDSVRLEHTQVLPGL